MHVYEVFRIGEEHGSVCTAYNETAHALESIIKQI